MRILYVTNGFPFPLTSGYLRHYFLIRELSARHAITLFSIVGADCQDDHVAALEPYTERVQTFVAGRPAASAVGKIARKAGALARGDEAARRMRLAIEEVTRRERFDAMVFSGKRTLPAIAGVRDLPTVVDMCDATSVRVLGKARHAPRATYPLQMIKYMRVRQTEKTLLRRADHLMFASCRDREALCGQAADDATVIPNGVDLDYWHRTTPELGRDTIVLTGAMHYGPNWDAAIYLIDEILPLVRRTVPGARVLIVGRDPHPRLVEAGKRDGVEVTGFVDDVRPYLDRASVFAAPLRFGAGIQNKLLEALAAELPVVASPLAADGLRTEDGASPPVDVAEDAEKFAEAITARLLDQASSRRPHAEGRRFTERHFVWKRSGEKLENVLDSIAAG